MKKRSSRARHGEAPPPEVLPPTRLVRLLEERQNEPWVPYARELLAENGIMLAALEKIRNDEGQVCIDFTACKHRGCNSSYRSWQEANAALEQILIVKKTA